ncbi:MAG TPA: YihY/virulence factor BrkB family protein [Erythrobacter sp.]|nr:YihY/virulence factor BrkB family protein [Erythrobacter sp.]
MLARLASNPSLKHSGRVARRVAVGTFNEGFIHAGNLAYLSMLAIFPFFILGAALFDLIGGRENAQTIIFSVARAMPDSVAAVIVPVAENVIYARSGWLLWAGAAVGLWTVSSLIETIRDILRRAYDTKTGRTFWQKRLVSIGLILGAVVLLMLSLFAQVLIGAAQEVIQAVVPQLGNWIGALRLSRIVPGLGLAASLWVLFVTLTPLSYRGRQWPKWPGAVFTTVWWLVVAAALPVVLRSVFTYDLTYGSLAGSMVTLLFFWLVGLGLVIGAELNAALAHEASASGEPREEKA